MLPCFPNSQISIEHLWDVLDQQIQSMLMSCQTPQDTFRCLVKSMPRRIRAGLAAQGGTIWYLAGGFNVVADQCIFIYCLSSLPTERISSTVCIRTAHGGDSDCPLCHNSCILLQGDSLLLSQISCGKQCSFHISVDAGERYEWCTLLCTVLDCKPFLSFSASHRYEATHGCTMKVRGCASKKTNNTNKTQS